MHVRWTIEVFGLNCDIFKFILKLEKKTTKGIILINLSDSLHVESKTLSIIMNNKIYLNFATIVLILFCLVHEGLSADYWKGMTDN